MTAETKNYLQKQFADSRFKAGRLWINDISDSDRVKAIITLANGETISFTSIAELEAYLKPKAAPLPETGSLSAPQKKYLTTKEAAEYLGVSKQCIYDISMQKRIPTFKPGGSKVYFLIDDLNDYIQSARNKSKSEIQTAAEKQLSVM